MSGGNGLSGELVGDGHRLLVRVYFEDTDFSGIVYHARYLHFLERGRTDFLRLKGIGHRELLDGAFGEPMAFAVRSMTVDFLAPARIDDVLSVETRPTLVGGARIVLSQELRLDDRVILTAAVKVAVLSPDGRPRRMPRAVAERLGTSPSLL